MNLDIILALVFYAFLVIFFIRHRSRFEVQGKIFALYRTKLGLKLMDKIAKTCPRLLHILGILGIIIGFIGMVFILFWLFKGTFDLIFLTDAAPAVAPVLPGIKVVPGLPVLSFLHWIIAILIIAIIHEFSHGIYARLYNVKIKSSGFAFFGPILAAFVEPDEKQLSKKSRQVQLSVFAAGPFSNILTGFLFVFLMSAVTLPLYGMVYDNDGIQVNNVVDDLPMAQTGIETPFVIRSVNGMEVLEFTQFLNATKEVKPNEELRLGTDKGDFTITTVENPDNASKGFIGVSEFELVHKPNQEVVEKYGSFLPPFMEWIHMLMFWLWVVSWGVGLFNLLPLGPIDGGRMALVGFSFFSKKEKKVHHWWTILTFICIMLIVINLLPFLWKLLLFIISPITQLFV